MEKKKLGRTLVVLVVVPVLVKGLESTFAEPIKSAVVWFWDLLVAFYGWMLAPQSVSGWVLLLLCMASLLLFIGILFDIVNTKAERSKTGGQKSRDKSIFDFHTYTTDVFDGARWRWNYYGNSISSVAPYCPDCDSQLIRASNGYVAAGINLFCERCNRIVMETGMDYPEEIEARAKREIGRRIRMRAREYTHED